MKLQNYITYLLSTIFLLTACSSDPSKIDNTKYPISKDVLQESIDLGMNITVDTTLYNEPIRLSDYKNTILLAKDCEGQILEINTEDVIKAWTEYSEYKCNDNFSDITPKEKISGSTNTLPSAEFDMFATYIHEKVQLDGSKSFDPGRAELSYHWRFVSTPPESSSKIDYPNSPKPCFTPDVYGEYIIELVVANENDATSSPKTVTYSPRDPYAHVPAEIAGTILKLFIGLLFLGAIL